ncbi:N-alpha-acetyltransferase 30 isoform X1 [Colossoma macropomum]|uniref:N-alpha-acetyltransferase 30 isoform X1 n=1 Tax=Colossoma macropomum TaxID=42526 RepID=UPI001863FEA9|nr:N-alpha-acetyltransferase 30 isoform X1 [Colossoma macropomum]
MAEVPPGPNALSASPAEIIPLPVDGCSFLGNNEKLDRGRGDVIALGTEPQQATEPRGIIKTKQNNVHPNSSLTQLNGVGEHTEEEEEEDGEHCSRVSVSNHVPHPAHRAAVSERLDGERSASVLTNNECENRTVPNNEVSTAAISENSSDEPECDNSTCSGTVNSRTVGNLSLAEAGGEGQELAADDGSKGRAVEEEAPVAQMANLSLTEEQTGDSAISYVRYESELQMPDIIRLITKDLSEPYSIYTYRYFIHNWPQLCFLAMVEKNCVGAIVCKLDMHKKMFRRGYIAMLAVDSKFRRKGIGTNLVKKAIYAMVDGDCDEVVLETEITNKSALKLYENLGFVRDKRLFRYYLNGVDALRLKLWLR